VVDNFQGEENRIILLSLVRSNVEQRLGYIAVDNRICVALSRAQDGFYVVGNFRLLAEHNETWKTIVNKVKKLKLIGPGLNEYYYIITTLYLYMIEFQVFR
jgi:superfamily I DNA and/or RNA helicase